MYKLLKKNYNDTIPSIAENLFSPQWISFTSQFFGCDCRVADTIKPTIITQFPIYCNQRLWVNRIQCGAGRVLDMLNHIRSLLCNKCKINNKYHSQRLAGGTTCTNYNFISAEILILYLKLRRIQLSDHWIEISFTYSTFKRMSSDNNNGL